jgi:hypothetical protein
MKVSGCLSGMLALLALGGTSCSTPDSTAPIASNSGKYYAVSVKEAEFYRYGPQQGSGPDQKLPQDTLVMLIRPSFGYSKVQLMNGQQGYVASQDIRVAPPEVVSSATTPPASDQTNRMPRFRYDITDPRFLPPPEPLPENGPEPTPIPGAEPSPSP